MKWVKEFTGFLLGKRLKQRSGKDIQAFLAELGSREGIADWQVRQAEHALRILYEIFLPQHSATRRTAGMPSKLTGSENAITKAEGFRDRVIPGEVERRFSPVVEAVRTAIRTRHYSYRTETSYLDWVRRYIAFHGDVGPSRDTCRKVEDRSILWGHENPLRLFARFRSSGSESIPCFL